MLNSVEDLLACPVCGLELAISAQRLVCPAAHSFDVASQGYVELASPPGKRLISADTVEMVDSRLRFLEALHYAPMVAALVEALRAPPNAPTPFPALADLGSGPGYYSRELLHSVSWLSRAIACDASLAAVKRAARIDPRVGAVRCDTRATLPILSHTVDAVLIVFAPRNASESHRILRPGGRLVTVIPAMDHLGELTRAGALLNVEGDKVSRLTGQMGFKFDLVERKAVKWLIPAEPEVIRALINMGPSAHHSSLALPPDVEIGSTLTASVEVLVFRPDAHVSVP
jgi:23S rRNA (guanine745-N1)-methyltransferase